MSNKHLRNFCIIAHIDHGKSTLADRLIEQGRIVDSRLFQEQLLDTMDIERERGISIKSHAISIPYRDYRLNLVDTPGHVDFSYEVSRAIASCEGAVLLVDATQGVQAQTLSNLYMALEYNLEILPVVNKIDLNSARVDETVAQIEHELGLDPAHTLYISAKQGTGIDELLEAIVTRIPPPVGESTNPLQACIFDSHYDPYRGTIAYLRMMQGRLRPNDVIRMWTNKSAYRVEEIGHFNYNMEATDELQAGDIGYMIAGIKVISDIAVGDTVTLDTDPCKAPLPGFRPIKPVVFSSIYPVDSSDYEELVKALEKLKLNDAALLFEKDSSTALGHGFRGGFLGLLHLEITQERLEREFGLAVVLTAPSVQYRIIYVDGRKITIRTPQELPPLQEVAEIYEPYIDATIICPAKYIGNMMRLCMEKRGTQQDMRYLDQRRVELHYHMPLADILFDFYDNLKSISQGYASFDYELIDDRQVDLVRLDILIHGNPVDALSQLIYRKHAETRAHIICRRLREEIPRHQFKIPIQGAIGNQIVARETISAYRKDVTAKCYGGDITRKRKLLEKQKSGKRRMKMVGNVELPQSAFLSVMKTGDE